MVAAANKTAPTKKRTAPTHPPYSAVAASALRTANHPFKGAHLNRIRASANKTFELPEGNSRHLLKALRKGVEDEWAVEVSQLCFRKGPKFGSLWEIDPVTN